MIDDRRGRRVSDDPRLQAFGSHGASLRDELGGVFTDERLLEWVGNSDERRGFLADKILGTISWSRRLGRPETPSMSDAFRVERWCYDRPERPGDPPSRWQRVAYLALCPLTETEEDYHVGFFGVNGGERGQKIVAQIAGYGWEGGGPLPGSRRVDPPELAVGVPTGQPVCLSFRVVFDVEQELTGTLVRNWPSEHSSGGGGGVSAP